MFLTLKIKIWLQRYEKTVKAQKKNGFFFFALTVCLHTVVSGAYPMVMVYSLMNEEPGCRWFM